jgi:large subunit ribosomal protein L22
MKGYSIQEMPEKSAIARAVEVDISLKDAVNVAHYIRGMGANEAVKTMDEVIEKKKPVPYFRYLDSVSHRKGIGPGRFPVRAAKAFKATLENAISNAEFKNLDVENLRVVHVEATKGRMLKKYRPKAHGTAGLFVKDLVNISMVVTEESR